MGCFLLPVTAISPKSTFPTPDVSAGCSIVIIGIRYVYTHSAASRPLFFACHVDVEKMNNNKLLLLYVDTKYMISRYCCSTYTRPSLLFVRHVLFSFFYRKKKETRKDGPPLCTNKKNNRTHYLQLGASSTNARGSQPTDRTGSVRGTARPTRRTA